jgi:ribosomal protein S18 acetylase RimI-like enzyme
MEIRPMTIEDFRSLADIDGTIESMQYLHLDRTGEGLAIKVSVEARPTREKQIISFPVDEDLNITWKQIASGADEGVALVAVHDETIVAAALAQPDPVRGTMRLLDIRVDYDFRRQGIGIAMLYQIIQQTRDADLRAVSAEVRSNNYPASQFLLKAGFDLSGVDVRRHSNHDIVKESATLFWYAALD